MKLFSRGIVGVVVAVAVVGCSSHSTGSAPVPTPRTTTSPDEILGHDGRWTTDSDGKVVMFHGVNMVAKTSPYEPSANGFDDDDADFLAANGFSVVRLGVIFKGVEPTAGQFDDRYLDEIEKTVETLGSRGIRSLLDFHQDGYNEVFHGEGFPDWAVPPQYRGPFSSQAVQDNAMSRTIDMFWTDATRSDGIDVQQEYANAVAHVAARFAENPNVLGYDLINEPMPGYRWPECRSTPVDCSGFDTKDLGRFQQRLITAIRGVDTKHLVWYEPNTLFDWGLPTKLPKFADTRLGMAFHDYCPPLKCERYAQLRNAVQRSAATGDAIMLTEFWSIAPDAAGVTEAADTQLMSWSVWAYCGCGDPTGSTPPEAEGIVRDPEHAPKGNNVDESKLQVLARPYPHVIAGTPQMLSFDRDSRAFVFEYTTARASGTGHFATNACTQIVVPRVQYPSGYKVEATGARVVSGAGAGVLSVRATGATSKITVKITPTEGSETRPVTLTSGC
jgi:endoglycosylceramidase